MSLMTAITSDEKYPEWQSVLLGLALLKYQPGARE